MTLFLRVHRNYGKYTQEIRVSIALSMAVQLTSSLHTAPAFRCDRTVPSIITCASSAGQSRAWNSSAGPLICQELWRLLHCCCNGSEGPEVICNAMLASKLLRAVVVPCTPCGGARMLLS